MNKQNIPWGEVEQYLKKYIGTKVRVQSNGDIIHIGSDFPEEFAESKYTKSLRGSAAKAKANAAQVIEEMLSLAENRRWVENKEQKHAKDALYGWYRYDTYFGIPVQGSGEMISRTNFYRATLVVRYSASGLYLYDVINIKKEASKPLES